MFKTKPQTLATIMAAFTKPLADLEAFSAERRDIAARARAHADALEAEAVNQRDGAHEMELQAIEADAVKERLSALVNG